MSSYQQGLELAAERAKIVEEYIDDHELLKDSDAFGHDPDRNGDALVEIWRIIQTRSAHETDIAVADIRSVMGGLILAAAERFADKIMQNREMNPTRVM